MSGIALSVRVEGLDQVFARLDSLANPQRIKAAIEEGAALLVEDAKNSIEQGPKTGRMYGHHQASAPGEAPANWTGDLMESIESWDGDGPLEVEVGSELGYATDLEYGTRNMAARPFLNPALDKNRAAIVELITTAVNS